MGQKTHPIGLRLGGVIDWQSQWFAKKGKEYAKLTNEDREIRDVIVKELGENALQKFDKDAKAHMSNLNKYSEILYKNFKKLVQ